MGRNQFAKLLTEEEMKNFFQKHFFEVGTIQITKVLSNEEYNMICLTLHGNLENYNFEIYYDDFGIVVVSVYEKQESKEAFVYESILWLDEIMDIEEKEWQLLSWCVRYVFNYELTTWILYLLSLDKEWKSAYQTKLSERVRQEQRKEEENLSRKIEEIQRKIEKAKGDQQGVFRALNHLKEQIENN